MSDTQQQSAFGPVNDPNADPTLDEIQRRRQAMGLKTLIATGRKRKTRRMRKIRKTRKTRGRK